MDETLIGTAPIISRGRCVDEIALYLETAVASLSARLHYWLCAAVAGRSSELHNYHRRS